MLLIAPLTWMPSCPPFPLCDVGHQALASVDLPLLAAGGIISRAVVGDGLPAGGAVPQEPGAVKLQAPGQARAVVEGEPGGVVDMARQGVQAEQRRDHRPAWPPFNGSAPFSLTGHLAAR